MTVFFAEGFAVKIDREVGSAKVIRSTHAGVRAVAGGEYLFAEHGEIKSVAGACAMAYTLARTAVAEAQAALNTIERLDHER